MAILSKRKLKVLFATSEAAPFAKSGGLGDVGGSLPSALSRGGCDISVIMPKYGSIPEKYKSQMRRIAQFYVPLAWRNVWCGIEKLTLDGVDYYFVDNEDYFKRDNYYGYFDDGERFAFFSKAITEAMGNVDELMCDVLHCNDWQTALAPVFLREFYQGLEGYEAVKTVFTVHNVKFQGQYSDFVLDDILGMASIPAARDQLTCAPKTINYMKGALCYSDIITTVSPTYAQELKMAYYGEGLQSEFQRRSQDLYGVLNGIDIKEFDPSQDKTIEATYSASNLKNKALCKQALQEELGLRCDPERPLVAMVGRLTKQKGMDLVQYAMDTIMSRGVQVVLLGTGDKEYEDSMKYFDWKYQDMMRAVIAFDTKLAKRIYAGSDIFLMPSQFEPCGLSQMMAMRYGSLPLVRETGGLVDTVVPYNKYTGEGTGFRFANFNADEMCQVLLDACELFWTDKKIWKKLQVQAMNKDFSWSGAADDYIDLYHKLRNDIPRYYKRRDK